MISFSTGTASPILKWDGRWFVMVCFGLALGFSARADTWTNRAGHTLSATLVAIEGEQIVLRQADGRTRRLPLSSLTPADQERAKAQTRSEPLPSELRTCLAQAREDIHRAAQFLHGGKISREEYAERCRQIARRFESLALQSLRERGQPPNHAPLELLKQQLIEEGQCAEIEGGLPPS